MKILDKNEIEDILSSTGIEINDEIKDTIINLLGEQST